MLKPLPPWRTPHVALLTEMRFFAALVLVTHVSKDLLGHDGQIIQEGRVGRCLLLGKDPVEAGAPVRRSS